MTIKPALQCASLGGWYPKEVQSASDPDTRYVVHVNPWANRHEQHVCECKSYQYRGHCKHQIEAHTEHCGWNEIEGPEVASDKQRSERVCPRCSGPAVFGMWEFPDE